MWHLFEKYGYYYARRRFTYIVAILRPPNDERCIKLYRENAISEFIVVTLPSGIHNE